MDFKAKELGSISHWTPSSLTGAVKSSPWKTSLVLWWKIMAVLTKKFVRRGFSECSIDRIPAQRRKKINLSRRSKYYMKKLLPDRSGIRFDSPFS